MPIFKLEIRGENFRWKVEDQVKFMGFYTTHWIEASDEFEAEALVVAKLKETPELRKPDWHDGSEPNAKVYVEEITELASGWDGKANIGFVWFEEGS